MDDPNLLIPAIVVFALMLIGLGLTVREFSSKGNVGRDPVDHSVEVVKPGTGQPNVE